MSNNSEIYQTLPSINNLIHLNNTTLLEPNNQLIRNSEKPRDTKIIISEKPVDPNASFFATFRDGSSFRNMIEYIRLVNIDGIFRFSKENVFYEKGDNDNNILNVIKLKTYELTDYEFESESEEIVISTNMSDFRNITRNVGKKDHIDVYKLPNEPNNLYLRIKGDKEQTFLLPLTNNNEYTLYTLPVYSRLKNNPTCTINQNDFSKLCKSINTTKCVHAIFHGFDKGIICKGIFSTGQIGSVEEFGKCRTHYSQVKTSLKSFYPSGNIIKSKVPPPLLNISEIGEIERFKIDIKIIKYLIKLNALSPTGTIKIYIEKGLPFKMVCNIGTFGKITVYLMSS